MSFSAQLRSDADVLFDAIYHHPFVQDIAHERLSREAIVHYVQQDVMYLNTYARVYGLGIAKADTREQMKMFHQLITVVLSGELVPHYNLCRVAGVAYEDMKQPVPVAPTAHHYMRHMLTSAYTGQLPDIVAAVLPCFWTYVDFGRRLAKDIDIANHPEHAFYDWISFYASEEMLSGLKQLTDLLDTLMEHANAAYRANIKAIFDDGCRMEYRFFEMAYTQERWSPGATARPANGDGTGNGSGNATGNGSGRASQ